MRVESEHPPAPRISIVLSFRDAEATFEQALASLLWQTEPRWELIAIDDGSRSEVISRALATRDPRIRAIRHASSAGLSRRLNEGVALARAAYVARMDADDICLPHRLATQADFLDAHPAVDLLASAMLVIDENDELLGVLPCQTAHEAITARPWLRIPMPHPTWMGRKAWFQAHPYEERARRSQDQHLLYRTYRESRFAAISQPLLVYRHAALSLRKSLAQRRHFLRAVHSHGTWSDAVKSTAMHGLAACRDIGAVATGLSRSVVASRVQPASPEQRADWLSARAALNDGMR